MLSLKTIKILKGLGIGAAAVVATSVGVGYYFSDLKNPYNEYFKRPVVVGPSSLSFAYSAAKEAGAKIIMGTGFTHDGTISALSGNPSFDEVGFLGIDVTYTGNHPENVATVNFKTEQSGFLTGIATGMYLNDNKSFFEKMANDGKTYLSYAMWGGISGDSVDSYLAGFQQGIVYFNDKIVKDEKNGLKKIYMAVQKSVYSYGFSPTDGNSILGDLLYGNSYLFEANGQNAVVNNKNNKLIKLQPSAIFPVAGPQTATAVSKVLSDNKKIAVIGVDTAMEDDPNTTKSYGPSIPTNELPKINGKTTSIIPFSAIKNMSNSTQQILNNIFKNDNTGSKGIGGFGYSSIGNLSNNGAGISSNGYVPLIKAMQKLNIDKLKLSDNFDFNNVQELNNAYEKIKNYFINDYNINELQNLKSSFDYPEINKGIFNPTFSSDFSIKNVMFKPLSNANWFNGIDVKNKAVKFTKFLSEKLNYDFKQNKSKFKNDIKIILSTPTSILFDHSFSEAGYIGIYNFYLDKEPIPVPPKASK